MGSVRQYLSFVATKLLFSLGWISVMISLLALLRLSQINFRVTNCSARLICKAPFSAHITPFLFELHWLPVSSRIPYKMVLTCFRIFLVQFLHTSLSCFTFTLLLAFFAHLPILGSSVFLGWVGGPLVRHPFSTSDPSTGTLFLSLSGILLHCVLFSQKQGEKNKLKKTQPLLFWVAL